MPIYKAKEMKETPDVKRPHISMIQYGGELIKAGLVTYYEGDAPPPHYHPNDEQWIYLLEGSLAVLNGGSSGNGFCWRLNLYSSKYRTWYSTFK